jgi:hypothetical protein
VVWLLALHFSSLWEHDTGHLSSFWGCERKPLTLRNVRLPIERPRHSMGYPFTHLRGR